MGKQPNRRNGEGIRRERVHGELSNYDYLEKLVKASTKILGE